MTENVFNLFKNLYDNIPFPIQAVNSEGHIIYINKSYNEVLGYQLKELSEYSIYDDSELKKINITRLIENIFENSTFNSISNYTDSLIKRRNITTPIFNTKIFGVTLNEKRYLIFFHEDQSELYLSELEIRKAKEGNKEAERLKNTFLNVLSHELRTPLNIILGYSSIIKETLRDKISSDEKFYLDNLHSGSERLFKSITQMLEFAQLEAGNYKIDIETVELTSIIKNGITSIKTSADEKKIDVRTNFQFSPIYIDVDVHCLENAISNLLNNAVKFTKQGFIEVEAGIIKEREIAFCKVKDSGVGISSEYLDHLYRPFSQEDLNIGRNYEGNGLGLALSKRYIEKVGGSLLVDSIKGVGTTFTFTLPLSQEHTKKEAKNGGLFKKRILMLDDSSESFDLINAFLKNTHQVEIHNFRDFELEHLKKDDYEIIVFDVNQNKWDQSLLVCRDIKKNDPFKRPLIIISSEFIEDKIKEFYAAGANKFIVKPFSKMLLLKTLGEVNAESSKGILNNSRNKNKK